LLKPGIVSGSARATAALIYPYRLKSLMPQALLLMIGLRILGSPLRLQGVNKPQAKGTRPAHQALFITSVKLASGERATGSSAGKKPSRSIFIDRG